MIVKTGYNLGQEVYTVKPEGDKWSINGPVAIKTIDIYLNIDNSPDHNLISYGFNNGDLIEEPYVFLDKDEAEGLKEQLGKGLDGATILIA